MEQKKWDILDILWKLRKNYEDYLTGWKAEVNFMNHVLWPVIAMVGSLIHIYFDKKQRSARRTLEIILLWFLSAFLGFSSILAFLGHTFAADKIEAFIGWMPGSPFQFEVAVANLAIGVLCISCIWLRGNFWIATVMAGAVFGFGAAFGHLREIIVNHNYAPGNAGAVLYLDIAGPVLLIVLLTIFKILEKRELRNKS
jgi:hypothetical protein